MTAIRPRRTPMTRRPSGSQLTDEPITVVTVRNAVVSIEYSHSRPAAVPASSEPSGDHSDGVNWLVSRGMSNCGDTWTGLEKSCAS